MKPTNWENVSNAFFFVGTNHHCSCLPVCLVNICKILFLDWGVVEAECCKRKHVYFSLCKVEGGIT